MKRTKYQVKDAALGQTRSPRVDLPVPVLYFELFTFDLLQRTPFRIESWKDSSPGQPDIGYHYYRRVADDDPIQDASREISVSFRQPPILKDGLPISYYRVGYSGISPDIPAYQVARFTASFYPGQDVIEASIVRGTEDKLQQIKKYNLEARTYVDDNTWSAPSVFTVIVQPNDP